MKRSSRLVETAPTAPTTLLALNSGFLCVISLLSTFFSPFVTASPLFKDAKTLPISPAGAAAFGAGANVDEEGAGGGGGGGGAPAEVAVEGNLYVNGSAPWRCKMTPGQRAPSARVKDRETTYPGVPRESCGVELHDILAEFFEDGNPASGPFDRRGVSGVSGPRSRPSAFELDV